ncbi:hypothetical protein BDZ91DRAFT_718933 [Kalaharituber pfeilii]|nr:hypothetical protein BDZ91DRAFT_718933 [Kalaharituber pfeilii]
MTTWNSVGSGMGEHTTEVLSKMEKPRHSRISISQLRDRRSNKFDYGPPQFEIAKSREEEPVIPDPAIFEPSKLVYTPLDSLTVGPDGNVRSFIPTVAQCATHLELLSCFAVLRQNVEKSEEMDELLFGKANEYQNDQELDQAQLKAKKDMKWKAFVEIAVARFYEWWCALPAVVDALERQKEERQQMTVVLADADYDVDVPTKITKARWGRFLSPTKWLRSALKGGTPLKPKWEISLPVVIEDNTREVMFRALTSEMLPPLDVLMVWHSFTLNPRSFYEDCLRLGRLDLWGMPLPWDSIHGCINSYDWTFKLNSTAERFFTRITGSDASLLESIAASSAAGLPPLLFSKSSDGLLQRHLLCPYCETNFPVGMTGWLERGEKFQGICPNAGTCGKEFDGEAISMYMFIRDVHDFLKARVANTTENSLLRGAILTRSGHFYGYGTESPNGWLESTLKAAFPELLPTVCPDTPNYKNLLSKFPTTAAVSDRILARAPTSSEGPHSIDTLKTILNNILTTYHSHPSLLPFSIDLAAAVHRQGVFIHKMHDDIRIIRSPAVCGTISRARDRYEKFFRLIAKYVGTIFVPCNDVDLVWHTMQCYPHLYYEYSNRVTGGAFWGSKGPETMARRYIDHNDRFGEEVLGTGFKDTKRIWSIEYGNTMSQEETSVRTSEEEEDALEPPKDDQQPTADSEYDRCVCWACEMRRDVEARGDEFWDKEREGLAVKWDWFVRATVHYYRQVEVARREGGPLLVWNRPKWVERYYR